MYNTSGRADGTVAARARGGGARLSGAMSIAATLALAACEMGPADHEAADERAPARDDSAFGPTPSDDGGSEPAELTIAPEAIDFGEVRVGEDEVEVISLENSGDESLEIESIEAEEGDCDAHFEVEGEDEGDGAFTIEGGESEDLEATFAPDDAGERACDVEIEHDAAGETEIVELSGEGVEPALTADPAAHDFGEVVADEEDEDVEVGLENTGDATLTIEDFGTAGDDCDDHYAFVFPDTEFELDPGQSSSFVATFEPADTGERACDVEVESDDPASPTEIALEGVGIAPVLALEPDAHDFGDVRVGEADSREIDIENAGTADLNVESMSEVGPACGAFAVEDITPVTVEPGESESFEASFAPSEAGGQSCGVEIASDDPDSPEVLSLSGEGVKPALALDPEDLDFEALLVGEDRIEQVAIENEGSAELGVTGFDTSGGDCADHFAFAFPETDLAIAPGESETFDAIFQPSARGERVCLVEVASDDPDAPHTAALTGEGIAAELAVEPGVLDLGEVEVGGESSEESFDIVNSGDEGTELTLEGLAVVGADAEDFAAAEGGDVEGEILGAGERHEVTIRFEPVEGGDRIADVEVTADDPVDPAAEVELVGKGLAPAIALVTDSSENFGDVRIGEISEGEAVAVENEGDAELEIEDAFLGGSNPGEFAFDDAAQGDPPFALGPGEGASWEVFCAPSDRGGRSAVFEIESDDADDPEIGVSLFCNGTEATLAADPSPIAFPETRVGEAATEEADLVNDGDVDLEIEALEVADAALTLVERPDLPVILAPGERAQVAIEFAPIQSGALGATLDAEIAEIDATVALAIDATGRVAEAALSDANVDFGDVLVGEAQTREVTLENDGDAAFEVVDVASSAAADFTAAGEPSGAIPTTLEPGEDAAIAITAHPEVVGTVTADVTVTTDIPDANILAIGAAATGVAPDLAVSQGAIDFGAHDVAAPPATRFLSVENQEEATAPVEVGAPEVEGPGAAVFAVDSDGGLPRVLEPGQSAGLIIAYDPVVASAGEPEALVVIPSDSERAEIPLAGRGIDRDIRVSPSGLVFPETRRHPSEATVETLEIENAGDASLDIADIEIDGPYAQAFALADGAFEPFSIAGGASRAIAVAFAPHVASSAPLEARLSLYSNDGESPRVDVALWGRGVLPDLAVSPGSLDLGRTGVGVPAAPAAVTIHNTSEDEAATLSELRLAEVDDGARAEGFSLAGADVPVTLEPGESEEVWVEFSPPEGGEYAAELEVFLDSDPEPVAAVDLRGEGSGVRPRGGGCAAGGGAPGAPAALVVLAAAALALAARRRRLTRGARSAS